MPDEHLHDTTIISCGLGEDASFDVEFAAKFGAKVIVVDPTPRAICHFDELSARIGQPATSGYAKGGTQPPESYDLSSVKPTQLVLEPFALWSEETLLRFYAPKDPSHVSHSAINFQNEYATDTPHIEVPATTLEALLAKYQLSGLRLLKMDIEGAEMIVVPAMLDNGLFPDQLLLEFDELTNPSNISKEKVEKLDGRLRAAGYRCVHSEGGSNFLYVRI